ncbi:MAG: hypothetical protein LBV38_07325 [Alistipes sp.]|jgi:acyl-ACP thioesterase|nr:hypothetical protein [Alistipes sp.]
MAGSFRYRIEQRDIDASQRVRLCAMGDMVLQAAGDDADILGFGVSDLNAGNASWVLSRMAIEMRRLPQRHEEIDIYTLVSDYGRLFTTRNMTVSDGKSVEIGAAVTQWAMIDLATRRPLDLSALSNKGTSLVDREPPVERPRKVGALAECSSERPYEVVYSDIDFNGHVNSMKYLEWMVDSLPTGVAARLGSFRLDINYIHEARLGDRLTICSAGFGSGDGKEGWRFEIRAADSTPICRAEITIAP